MFKALETLVLEWQAHEEIKILNAKTPKDMIACNKQTACSAMVTCTNLLLVRIGFQGIVSSSAGMFQQ